jgi:ArsR family transcriptional regulator, arsenate/arsenite/antimonite-responsive transcriptional repressor
MSKVTWAGSVVPLAREFQALADTNRLQVLELLRPGERCVCDLTDALHLGQSLVSFHLKVLKDAGLVAHHRSGRAVYYSVAPHAFERLREFLDSRPPVVP